MDATLDHATILAKLGTQFVGRNLEIHSELDSTNTRATIWAKAGCPDGSVVVAEWQTAGRGRLGRQWYAPPYSSLLMSLVLRPELAVTQAPRVTMLCSLAVVEAIAKKVGLSAQIKWPNDIQLAGKKVAGMLTELGQEQGRLTHIVVGIGLNVNLDVSLLPPLAVPATSLAFEAGHHVSRTELLVAILQAVEMRYLKLHEGWYPHEEWRAHLATLGQTVSIRDGKRHVSGIAIDVDPDGALLVRCSGGHVERILVGDVTLRDTD